jgi:hypothetical protein
MSDIHFKISVKTDEETIVKRMALQQTSLNLFENLCKKVQKLFELDASKDITGFYYKDDELDKVIVNCNEDLKSAIWYINNKNIGKSESMEVKLRLKLYDS